MVIIPSWDVERMQEEMARGSAFHYLAILGFLKDNAPALISEFNKVFAINKTYFLHMGKLNPLELAMAIAQVEQNLFGSKMEVDGDENSASVTYRYINEWARVAEFGILTEEDHMNMHAHFVLAIDELGREMELSTRVAYAEEGLVVTFSKGSIESQAGESTASESAAETAINETAADGNESSAL
ncbi:MAG TPA: hypothetical protein V6D17_07440 [Candidatus Obscuribacterales bacterium]